MHTYLMLLIVLIASLTQSGLVSAQAVPATPEPESASPKFAIVPAGDHPEGYFKDIEIAPGESINLEVAIVNFGVSAVDLETFRVNGLNGVNGGFVAGDQNEAPLGSASWIDYPTMSLTLAPLEEEKIRFTVSVPEDALPGQYISGLIAKTAEPVAIPGTDILNHNIAYAISVGILVPGELTTSFETGDPYIEKSGLFVPVQNTGNYLVRPLGEVVLLDADGVTVLTAQVEMGSVYAGLSTSFVINLPSQLATGQYYISLSLSDPESGFSVEVKDIPVQLTESTKGSDSEGVSLVSHEIAPNADEVVFANVDVTLSNGGQQIPASNITLEVMRDGEQVDTFPLATNQVLLSGENQFVTRYIPADMWQSGEYTFSIKVSAVDPNGGQETILLDEELDATIVVP